MVLFIWGLAMNFPSVSLKIITFFLLATFFTSACSTPRISLNDEINSSIATTTWLEHHYGIISHRPVSKLLARITSRLAEGAKAAMLYRAKEIDFNYRFTKAPWQVFVLNIDDPNAFSAGGGTIFITKGLLTSLPNEAALASVISHEMAHQMLGHNTAALEESIGPRPTPMFSYSLEREMEADSLSIRILLASRYNPRKALEALSIAYRPVSGNISVEEKNWLTLRAANLYQKIALSGSMKSMTISTREFNKVKRQLAKL